VPTLAAVKSKTFRTEVPCEFLYADSIPHILSAIILPCLFAGPASGIRVFSPVTKSLISTPSPPA